MEKLILTLLAVAVAAMVPTSAYLLTSHTRDEPVGGLAGCEPNPHCFLLDARSCATTFTVTVEENRTVFTVNRTGATPAPFDANLLWKLTVWPHLPENTTEGFHADALDGSRGTRFLNLEGPADEINVGDQFILDRALTSVDEDYLGGFYFQLSFKIPHKESWTIGTYPTCQAPAAAPS